MKLTRRQSRGVSASLFRTPVANADTLKEANQANQENNQVFGLVEQNATLGEMSQRAITSGVPVGSSHVKALDGLRGIAFTLVFLFHLLSSYPISAPGFLSPLVYVSGRGGIGVDVFFVLSGFLITSVLIKARGSANYFSVFYVRRSLRVFPLYYLALAYTVLMGSFPFRHQIWFWISCSNLLTAFNPFALAKLTHFWTLAIEEQFYLCWPLLVRRLSNRTLAAICLMMLPLQYVLRIFPFTASMDAKYSNFSYRLTPFHSEGLFVGALLAIWMSDGVVQRKHLAVARYTAVGSLALLVLVMSERFSPILWLNRATISLVSIFSAAVIAVVILSPLGWLGRWLAVRPIVLVGRYSYCMYVVHLTLLTHIYKWSPAVLTGLPWGFLLAGTEMYLLILLIAAFSWRLLEEPILSLKRFFMYRVKDADLTESALDHDARANQSIAAVRTSVG